ncbi:MAG: hypothetical protein K5912_03760 [Alphaproteobacteria bacterium]|nr:hypothetical protein [Alphaproteobacteria bacterium]
MSDIVYEKNVFSTPFLRGYKELKIPIIDAQGNPVWPALFPVQKIQQIRETVGERHFSTQMMLQYVPVDKIRLDPGALRLYEDDFNQQTAKIGENLITSASIYWDPAGGRKNSDNSVCALVYKDDKNKRFFIHDILYLIVPEGVEYPLTFQCNQVFDFVRKHKLRSLAVETNGIGGALPEIMKNIISGTEYKIQIKPVNNNRKKETRILDAFEPLLSSGRLYANTTITRTPLISEMLAWTPLGSCEHDDGLDAVSGAISGESTAVHPNGRLSCHYMANTDFNV